MRRFPDGWSTSTERADDGAIFSEQRAMAAQPAVEVSAEGARRLADTYWRALRVSTGGAAWMVERGGVPAVRVLGRWPALLRFGPPTIELDGGRVATTFPIRGGLLARVAAGEIEFAQERVPEGWRLTCTVRGFRPRLPATVYWAVQRRIHVWVGRLYLRTLLADPVRNGQ